MKRWNISYIDCINTFICTAWFLLKVCNTLSNLLYLYDVPPRTTHLISWWVSTDVARLGPQVQALCGIWTDKLLIRMLFFNPLNHSSNFHKQITNRYYQLFLCHQKLLPSTIIWPICSKCTLSLLPENIRKPFGSVRFSGVEKGCIGNKWVKKNY